MTYKARYVFQITDKHPGADAVEKWLNAQEKKGWRLVGIVPAELSIGTQFILHKD